MTRRHRNYTVEFKEKAIELSSSITKFHPSKEFIELELTTFMLSVFFTELSES